MVLVSGWKKHMCFTSFLASAPEKPTQPPHPLAISRQISDSRTLFPWRQAWTFMCCLFFSGESWRNPPSKTTTVFHAGIFATCIPWSSSSTIFCTLCAKLKRNKPMPRCCVMDQWKAVAYLWRVCVCVCFFLLHNLFWWDRWACHQVSFWYSAPSRRLLWIAVCQSRLTIGNIVASHFEKYTCAEREVVSNFKQISNRLE